MAGLAATAGAAATGSAATGFGAGAGVVITDMHYSQAGAGAVRQAADAEPHQRVVARLRADDRHNRLDQRQRKRQHSDQAGNHARNANQAAGR